MSQQFEQREEQLGKKDFAISQYEEIVSKLEEQILADMEVNEANVPYLEPVSSPEVDSLLNIFMRLNARLKGVSKMLDDEVFEYTPEEKEQNKIMDSILKLRDEEIQTLKGELDGREKHVNKLLSEANAHHQAIRDLELKIKGLVKENQRLEDLIFELKAPVIVQPTASKKK